MTGYLHDYAHGTDTGWVYQADCLDCDWQLRGGDAVNREAERHGKDTGHATVTRSRWEGC